MAQAEFDSAACGLWERCVFAPDQRLFKFVHGHMCVVFRGARRGDLDSVPVWG